MLVQRFDVGRLDRAKRTGAGGARVPASISRTGVQVYTDQQGRTVREYRPAETVFAAESLATLASIPVTVGHPPMGVTPLNHREVSVGHVTDAPPARRGDGPVEWVDTAVVVSDGNTLRRIDTGELTEVSMGYLAEVEASSGVSPAGEHYDAVQKSIRFNHLALLEDGHARAGSGARLRLDGNQELDMFVRADDNTTPAARLVKIDGVDVAHGSDTHVQMLERQIVTQTKRADEATALAQVKDAEIGTLKAKVDAILPPPNVEQLVADELAFRSKMLPLLPKSYDFAGKSRDDVRYDAVGAEAAGKIRALPEGQREGYLQAKLDERASGRTQSLHVPSPIAGDTKEDADESPFARSRKAYLDSFGSK